MSFALFLAIFGSGAAGALILPALAVQYALRYWVRPAQRELLEDAWSARFEEHLRALTSSVQHTERAFEK
jgi:hypothetical protein